MAIDGLLADPRSLADAVDGGAQIAVRQEFLPADLQQVADPAGLPFVLFAGGPVLNSLLGGSDDRKSWL